MIILNEKKYIEEMLELQEERRYTKSDFIMLIKYCINVLNLSLEETVLYINKYMEQNFDTYIKERYIDFLESTYKKVAKFNYQLMELDSVSLTDKEIEIIIVRKSTREQRVLATILILNKINNVNGVRFIYQNTSTIFELANVTISKKEQDAMFYSFNKEGLIKFDDNYDSLRFEVLFGKEGIPSLIIKEVKDVGKQYDKYVKLHYKGYKECSICGEPYKPKKTGRPTLICKECARKENIKKTTLNRQNRASV